MHSPGPLSLSFYMASPKQGPGLPPPSPGSPGAPCAVLSAITSYRPHLLLDQRLPEPPCPKYSINYDIKRLIMTVSFFRAPLCLLHLRASMDRFSRGTSLPPFPGSCSHTHQHTVVSSCAALSVFACIVLVKSNPLNEKTMSVIPQALGDNKRKCYISPTSPPVGLKQIEGTTQEGA